jgi:AbiV family abortive infection protein
VSSQLPLLDLTPEILRAYADAAIRNGAALIEEASLLEKHGHRARAYFLAIAAIEEIGKALLAFDAQARNLKDPAVVTKLRFSMTDHESKIRFAFTGFLVADPRKNVRPAIELMIALQRGREPAMYTDLRTDLAIHDPASAVRDVAAQDCIRLASDCFRSAQRYMTETVPERRTIAQDQLYSMRSSHIKEIMEREDFWWYYIGRMESGEKDFSEAVLRFRKDFLLKGRRYRRPESTKDGA